MSSSPDPLPLLERLKRSRRKSLERRLSGPAMEASSPPPPQPLKKTRDQTSSTPPPSSQPLSTKKEGTKKTAEQTTRRLPARSAKNKRKAANGESAASSAAAAAGGSVAVAGKGERVDVLPKVTADKKKKKKKKDQRARHPRISVLETPNLAKLSLAQLHDVARTECFEPGVCVHF